MGSPGGGALGHGDVVFVEGQLAAVDPGAETQVRGQNREAACHYTSDDGADVGAASTVVVAAAERGTCLSRDGPIAIGHGVSNCFTGSQWTFGYGLSWGGDGSAT